HGAFFAYLERYLAARGCLQCYVLGFQPLDLCPQFFFCHISIFDSTPAKVIGPCSSHAVRLTPRAKCGRPGSAAESSDATIWTARVSKRFKLPTPISENHLRRHLHDARIVGARDAAELRARHRPVRNTEARVIEQVEKLTAQLQFYLLGCIESLEHRGVGVPASRRGELVPAARPDGSNCVYAEGGAIEGLVDLISTRAAVRQPPLHAGQVRKIRADVG